MRVVKIYSKEKLEAISTTDKYDRLYFDGTLPFTPEMEHLCEQILCLEKNSWSEWINDGWCIEDWMIEEEYKLEEHPEYLL